MSEGLGWLSPARAGGARLRVCDAPNQERLMPFVSMHQPHDVRDVARSGLGNAPVSVEGSPGMRGVG
jgi:hypothetical protein